MSAFFIKKLFKKPKFYISFPENNSLAQTEEEPFWEVQRNEAAELLTNLYHHWEISWQTAKNTLKSLNLSNSALRRVVFYETEQKRAIITYLSRILVAWEKSDETAFSDNVLSLARELRPAYTYVESDPEEQFVLSEEDLLTLRNYIKTEATFLKEVINELQRLSWRKIDFKDKVLTENAAEQLLREKIGLTFYDFVDSTETPEFNSGYYPALLQESTDQGF